ncbi:hypothetical protein HN385_06865 [archaeon]|jgi:hypothetical protein|nr:hypothetical protein [archaeon]MBT3450994.1 hypothetical protein [archaeon]MBT6868586.1 hypothetical protein [archaeon]MBT7193118.1 hypothetical protein [archaeon]MBT7380435.1 hypothetical protein [archaeon]
MGLLKLNLISKKINFKKSNKLNKKAMGIQQVFVFMVTAITFAFIMIFGYSAIGDFLEKGEAVEFYQFKSEIENSIKRIYSEYGSVRQEDYQLPREYSQICFVDLDSEYNEELCNYDAIACDVWETASYSGDGYDSADENVFLKPSAPVAMKVYKVSIDEGFICMNINSGSFSLRLEGLGSRTKLSEAVYE